jgi:hypothetical protein
MREVMGGIILLMPLSEPLVEVEFPPLVKTVRRLKVERVAQVLVQQLLALLLFIRQVAAAVAALLLKAALEAVLGWVVLVEAEPQLEQTQQPIEVLAAAVVAFLVHFAQP